MRKLNVLTADGLREIHTHREVSGYGPWIPLTYSNGWSNYEATPSNYPLAGVRQAPGGRVELRGLIKGGTAPSVVAAILPEGCRPASTYEYLPISPSSGSVEAEIYVQNTGNLVVTSGTATWVNLNGLSFNRGGLDPVDPMDTGWIYPTLANGWSNFVGGGGWQPAAYRKRDGVVHLKGLISGGNRNSVPVFTLPPGFRTALWETFTGVGHDGSANTIQTYYLGYPAAGDFCVAAGGNNWSSLSGISFLAEA